MFRCRWMQAISGLVVLFSLLVMLPFQARSEWPAEGDRKAEASCMRRQAWELEIGDLAHAEFTVWRLWLNH
jgi:hypothetical protein